VSVYYDPHSPEGHDPWPLPDEGLRSITSEPGRKRVSPLMVNGKCFDYLHQVTVMPDDTVVIWAWPGQWRTEVFQTTVGQIKAALQPVPDNPSTATVKISL